ncbi:ATP-binding cassette domain-containing protein, partial [Rhodococcus hoagii]|nr:ATP-binding cassette domain-containing protein [Prescottella equi]
SGPRRDPGAGRGRVQFEDVRFGYDPETPLIEGLSLTAEPGQMVAIVGHHGCRQDDTGEPHHAVYELDGGRITLDGTDIAQDDARRPAVADRHGPAGHLAVRRHHPRQHRRSPERDGRAVREAARMSYVDRFVHMLPDGYDTVIDEEGSNVSAGETQLITIARAFIAQPSILILDEATSSVDTARTAGSRRPRSCAATGPVS